eukprot:TRINITY_DN319_c0_g1_i3.p1 TRINITY_DN319_c0_g1~~TRINITY_DN319_c0_g1_i3.p1  ORF type:complete len:655 (+),score=106.20 TRINITY_DN319_c0_g1_i3:68-1966(+)
MGPLTALSAALLVGGAAAAGDRRAIQLNDSSYASGMYSVASTFATCLNAAADKSTWYTYSASTWSACSRTSAPQSTTCWGETLHLLWQASAMCASCNVTGSPTVFPTERPTRHPSFSPTLPITSGPSKSPINRVPSASPTWSPTTSPTTSTPTGSPTFSPTHPPTKNPTMPPTTSPTTSPSVSPTKNPTGGPTKNPTTSTPTTSPTASPKPPTTSPTASPTKQPSTSPTRTPTSPTNPPTTNPTGSPTGSPTMNPTMSPTTSPPSTSPSSSPPSRSPSGSTSTPTAPTTSPTMSPTRHPTTSEPSRSPSTSSPTRAPIRSPTGSPQTAAPPASSYECVYLASAPTFFSCATTAATTAMPPFRPTGGASCECAAAACRSVWAYSQCEAATNIINAGTSAMSGKYPTEAQWSTCAGTSLGSATRNPTMALAPNLILAPKVLSPLQIASSPTLVQNSKIYAKVVSQEAIAMAFPVNAAPFTFTPGAGLPAVAFTLTAPIVFPPQTSSHQKVQFTMEINFGAVQADPAGYKASMLYGFANKLGINRRQMCCLEITSNGVSASRKARALDEATATFEVCDQLDCPTVSDDDDFPPWAVACCVIVSLIFMCAVYCVWTSVHRPEQEKEEEELPEMGEK